MLRPLRDIAARPSCSAGRPAREWLACARPAGRRANCLFRSCSAGAPVDDRSVTEYVSRAGPIPDVLTLVGSRAIPTLLFTIMVVVQVEATMQASSVSGAAFHVLSGALWVMFTVLINIRPAPIRRDRAPVGVAVALLSQLTMISVGLFGADAGAGPPRHGVGLAALRRPRVLARLRRRSRPLLRHPPGRARPGRARPVPVGAPSALPRRAHGRPRNRHRFPGIRPPRPAPGWCAWASRWHGRTTKSRTCAPSSRRTTSTPRAPSGCFPASSNGQALPAAVASRPDAIAMSAIRQIGITSAARRPICPAVKPITAGPMIPPT